MGLAPGIKNLGAEDLEILIEQSEEYLGSRRKEVDRTYRYAENITAQKRNELITMHARELAELEEKNRRIIRAAIKNHKSEMEEIKEIESGIREKRAILEKLKEKKSEK